MKLLLFVLLALWASWGSLDAAEAARSKPNVLFIVIEDTNWKSFGCYGNTVCKTPNLDKLARSGIMFDHAYCQGSACNASRTSFATGMRPKTTRVWNNRQQIREEMPEWIVGMPELFKEAGYATVDVGKFYHHGAEFSPKQMMGFTRIENGDRPEGWSGPPPIMKFPNVKPDKTKRAKSRIDREPRDEREKKRFDSDSYGDSGLDQENEGDWQRAKIASAVLEEMAQSKEPFFLVLSQSKPHTPFLSPTKFYKMYDPEKMPDPPAPVSSLKDFPYMKRATVSNNDIFREIPSTPVTAREALAAYYACISFVDDNIGMALDTLEKTGLDKNTIVVFIGDHGTHIGDHNMWSKYSMLEGTQRAPLIVRVPGAAENGKVCHEIVEFVDLLPTLIDLCGLRKPEKLEGVSFVPLIRDKIATPWKKAAFLVDQDYGQVVRTKKYSYMEFGEPKRNGNFKAAMYDLEKDPHETINVVDDPRYAEVKRQLTDLLHKDWSSALPPGRSAD